mgnify:CR=1 FL=1
MSVVDNPHGSGKVLKYEDTGGQYANIRFDLRADHSAKFDLSTNNIFRSAASFCIAKEFT